jgi:excisionase family DNA binding protein
MSTFLTSQEMQDLISVDRSTVYRMAEDGRLPGVKVGRQWRFPADRVAAQLGLAVGVVENSAAPTHADDTVDGFGSLLRPDDAQSIADLIGELFGVMAVITDMEGRPVTAVANPCGYYEAIADQPHAVAACLSQWRLFADEPHVAPRWVRTHLGFLCARTFVWVDLKPVGMIVVGGVTPPSWPPPPALVESIADEIGIPANSLITRVGETWDLDVPEQRRVLRLLPQMGDLVSQLVTSHRHLVDCREQHVATGSRPGTNETHHDIHHVPQGGDRS